MGYPSPLIVDMDMLAFLSKILLKLKLGFATGTRVPGYPTVRPGPGIEMCIPGTRKISQNRNFYHGLQNETPQHVTFPPTAYDFNLAFAFEFMKVIAYCANINATHCH